MTEHKPYSRLEGTVGLILGPNGARIECGTTQTAQWMTEALNQAYELGQASILPAQSKKAATEPLDASAYGLGLPGAKPRIP